MDNNEKIALKIGKELATKYEMEEEEPMDEQDLIALCLEEAISEGQSVRDMSWRAGSGAGITKWRDYFWRWDDAGVYGPFTSFDEAELDGEFYSGHDEIWTDWVHEDYRTDEVQE